MTRTNWRKLEGAIVLLVVVASIVLCFFQLIVFWNNEQTTIQGQLIGLIIIIILVLSVSYLVYLSILYLSTLKLLENSADVSPYLRKFKQSLQSDFVIGESIIKPILRYHKGSEIFDYKNLLNLEYNRNLTKRQYVNYSIGIMITLGILGTFMGLVDSVQESSNILDTIGSVQNTDELAGKFKAPFSGMNTAFNTSIIGIIGAIVLGFLNSYTNKLNNFLFVDLEKQIQLQLIPELSPKQNTVERLMLSELETINRNYSNIFRSVKLELDKLVGSIALQQGELKVFTQEMKAETSNAILMFDTSLNKTHELHDEKAKLRHEAYIDGLNELAKTIGNNSDLIKDTIIKNANKVDEYLRKSKSDFIESLNESQTTFSKNLTSQEERFNKRIEKTGEKLDKIVKESIDRNDKRIERLYKSSADQAAELSKTYKDETEKYIGRIENTLEEKNSRLIEQIDLALKNFNGLQEKISNHLERSTAELQKESKSLIAIYKKTNDEYLEKIKTFQTTFESYILNMEEANITIEKSNELFLGLTDSYGEHSNNLTTLQERVNQITSDYDQRIKSLKDETEKLSETFQSMSNAFEKLRKEEGKISATFEQLLDVVIRNLDSNGKN